MGGIGGWGICVANVPHELMATWLGLWVWIKTLFFAFSSSLATGYAGILIERMKEKKNPEPQPRIKRKNRAA